MADEQPTLTLEEALALMDKHTSEAEAAAEAVTKKKKKEKIKAIVVKGAEQGRGGLGVHTKNLLDKVDD